MIHLGRDVSALVDGQLPQQRAERALAHLVRCQRCAASVAAERASRRRLADAREVEPSTDLTDRLLRVAATPPGPRPRGVRAWVRRVVTPLEDRRVRRRAVTASGVTLAGAASLVLVLALVGAVSERARDPARMLDQASAGMRAQTAQRIALPRTDLTGPAAGQDGTAAVLRWMTQNEWCAPTRLPETVHVSDVRVVTDDTAPVLEVELVGAGQRLQIIEQRGRLSPDMLAQLEEAEVGGSTAHRVPGSQERLVVQCGETAVMVVGSTALTQEVTGALPAEPYDTGLLGRADRGWDSVTHWTTELLGAGADD